MMLQAAVSLLNIGARRLGRTGGGDHRARRQDAGVRRVAAAGRDRARSRAGARRDRRRQGAAGDPRAQRARRSCVRCATRSPSCRWPTRARSAGPRGLTDAGRERSERQHSQAGPAPEGQPGRSASRRGAGRTAAARDRPSRAAGCGCPDAETLAASRRALAAGRQRLRGRHDRLRARLRRMSARCERSGRQMCARTSSRGTPIRPRRISVEQLSDEPWGRRRPRLRRLCRGLRPR